ncbi:MAG TPA: sigma-70 family RNA polymerase sigma factor [Polyangiaceae bacterium]|nr:sigma-70 family RNA polymerase sigma factor [Polyangiaceae bacterium]
MTYAAKFTDGAAGLGAEVHALPYPADPQTLVAGLCRRHPGAAAAFHQRYVSRISGMLYRLLGPDPELSDVLQDCFVRVLSSIEQLRDPGALDSWVLGVAVLTAKIHLQRRRRRSWLRFGTTEQVPEPVFEGAEPSTREALQATHRVLERLSVDERLVFVLRHSEHMTVADMSSRLGTSVSTVKRRLLRAEQRFSALARKEPALETWLEQSSFERGSRNTPESETEGGPS